MDIAQLPYIDEHTIDIAADAADVWPEILEGIERSFSHRWAELYARALRCDDVTAGGPRPFAVGSTVPGFRVTALTPRAELVLEGHHRFSSYALVFRIEAVRLGQARLHAETRAAFPGFAARVYRLLIIGTGGHVVAVRRLLAGITRRAEVRERALS
jgi:hypothetical protein